MLGIGIALHCQHLCASILVDGGFNLSMANTASMIGLELALTALIAAIEPTLRGISAGLLLLGAFVALATLSDGVSASSAPMIWQLRAHVLTSLLSYGLITVGAIVAVYAMIHERRLHARKLTAANSLFAPLETTERLLFGIAAVGFAGPGTGDPVRTHIRRQPVRPASCSQDGLFNSRADSIRRPARRPFFLPVGEEPGPSNCTWVASYCFALPILVPALSWNSSTAAGVEHRVLDRVPVDW